MSEPRVSSQKLRHNRAVELDAEIKRLSVACRLDAWNAFVEEMKVPGDIYPALASGRPELIKLVQPRALTADEAKVLFDIIASLIGTNIALREHAEKVAQLVDNWAGMFAGLQGTGQRIQRFAQFDRDASLDDEEEEET